jgi:hypothetical protein
MSEADAPATHAAPAADAAPATRGVGVEAISVPQLALQRAQQLGRAEPVRAWTPLGTIDAGAIADVDGAGLVQLRNTSWSVDWWIGAEDRWHHPSTDTAVRQHDDGDGVVVETAMRVPGGDVVQRVFALRASSPSSGWDDSAVVVEIENLTAVPVALALVVRPLTLDGDGALEQVAVDGATVRSGDDVLLVVSRPAARMVVGELGTVAGRLAAGDDSAPGASTTGSRLEAAVVVPLPHSSTVRVLLPRVAAPSVGSGLPWRRRSERGAQPGEDWQAPDATTVVSGWSTHMDRMARVSLPEPALGELVAAGVRSLSVAATDGWDLGTPGGPSSAWRTTVLCEQLVRAGVVEPLAPLARALAEQQRLRGPVRMEDGSDATLALLHAAAPLLAGAASPRWVEELLGPVAKAIHHLGRGRGLDEPEATESARTALGNLVGPLRAIGQPDVAQAAVEVVAGLDTIAAVDVSTDGDDASTFVTGRRMAAAVRAGRPGALGDLIGATRSGRAAALPDRVDHDGQPCGRLGDDVTAVASRLGAVLDSALFDDGDGLVALPAWDDGWYGQSVDVHGLRTRYGTASFALRWHGERPALLWEVDPGDRLAGGGVGDDAPDAAAPVWRSPQLDPDWQGRGWSGEALLARVEPPAGVEPTLLTADHMQSGQRIDDDAEGQGTSAEDAAPGEGISFS